MSTEKIIRNQAKKSLSGNWTTIIAAIIFISAALILADDLFYAVSFYFKLINTETGIVVSQREWIYNIVLAGLITVLFLISPVFNGFLKLTSNVAIYDRTEIYDLFYFFRGARRYFKTLLLNLILSLFCILLCYGLDLYAFVAYFLNADLRDGLGFDIITLALLGAMIISNVVKILVYLIFMHYPLMAYSMNDCLPLGRYIYGFIGFSLRNLGAAIKLLLSFLGWIALCFFIVPALYVLPYLAVSMSNSAKWLFSLEKNRGLLC